MSKPDDQPFFDITRTAYLIAHIEELLSEASTNKADMGAVNWGDLGVVDVEYRRSMMHPDDGPYCVVIVEEASPNCGLHKWLNERIDRDRFPSTCVECEW